MSRFPELERRGSVRPNSSSHARELRGEGAVVQSLGRRWDDVSLVGRARAGERWAGEELFRRHHADVQRVATLLLGRTADVDDVVQDTFVKALRKLHDLQDPSAFGAWTGRIAANLARSRLRHRSMLRRFGLDRGEEDVGFEELAAPGIDVERRAQLAELGRVLRELPADARVAWTLRRVEGWALQEIAESVGASLATVKRRVSAADDELEKKLGWRAE